MTKAIITIPLSVSKNHMTGCLDPGNFEIRIDSITYIETPYDLHVRTNSIKM